MGAKIIVLNSLTKNDQFLTFSVLSWGGGHGRGATTITTTITTTTTTSKFLPPLGAENSEFPICLVLAQGCRKGDPQT